MKKQTKYIIGGLGLVGVFLLYKSKKNKGLTETPLNYGLPTTGTDDVVIEENTPVNTIQESVSLPLVPNDMSLETVGYQESELDREDIRITIFHRDAPERVWYWQYNPVNSNVTDERLKGHWCGVYKKTGVYLNNIDSSMSGIKSTVHRTPEKWAVVFG
jgi:hypothetical protein